jgi:anti-sigma factor RsiW
MHQVIREHLEAILDGSLGGAAVQEVDQHLSTCTECNQLVGSFRDQQRLFRTLRVETPMDPAPGFYARVMDRVESQSRESVWFQVLESAFAWRLALASAMLVILIGGFVYSNEPETIAFDDAGLMYDSVAPVVGAERESVLVNLATYQGH